MHYIIFCYFILSYITLYHIINIILYYIILYYIILYYIILYYIILYYIILYYIILYYIILYYIILYYIILYYIISYSSGTLLDVEKFWESTSRLNWVKYASDHHNLSIIRLSSFVWGPRISQNQSSWNFKNSNYYRYGDCNRSFIAHL